MGKENAALLPEDNLDKIVASISGQVIISDVVGQQSDSFNIQDINTNYEIVGVYSIDQGTTWTDLTDSVASFTGFTAAPDVEVSARTDTDGTVRLNIRQSVLVNGGTDWGLFIKVAFLADADNTDIPSNIDTGLPSGSKALYDDRYNYMKIAKEGNFTVSSASAQTTEITHNLGFVPVCRVYLKRDVGKYPILSGDYGLPGSIGDAIRIDEEKLYVSTNLYAPTETLYLYYKIYNEEQ